MYILGVVEQSAVPEVMEAASVVVEEATVSAVELVQSVDGVLTGMAVNHIQKDHYTSSMCHVDQLLQFFGRSISTTTSMLYCMPPCRAFHIDYSINVVLYASVK